jgi:flagellar basal-body rod modification protein FlgD
MSSISSSSYLDQLNASNTTTAGKDRMNDLTMSDFIKMMVAELQNQDPMSPMSNTEMLQQVNQLRQISSNDKLSTGIEALTLGQALTTASGLIGRTVTGTDSLGEKTTGKVDKVTIEDGKPKIHIGSSILELGSINSVSN